MANQDTHSRASKVPSRAASLQRMLEIERKQKMERMQLQSPNLSPNPGRRGVSPASQNSSSSSSRTSALLHRRRDSSQPRSHSEDRKKANVMDFSLPPLSIHTQSKQRISLLPDLSNAKLSEPRDMPQNETRRPDRDALPSMQKAATAHESSNLKMVSFAAEEGDDSESSSICHSPTWDDYGKKKRKEPEAKRKRLTKEPPPAAMDNRPVISPRAMTDSTLSIQQLRQCLETGDSSQQLSSAPSAVSVSFPLEPIDRSPGFIGGVRLEREREATLKRMMDSRASSVERPVSEMMLQNPPPQLQAKLELAKKRETAPAVSYPPTSSKPAFMTDSRPPRSRRNSFGQGLKMAAGKLFNSKDKNPRNGQPLEKRNDSRASSETVQMQHKTSEDRGRQRSGSAVVQSRHQSYDSPQRDSFQTNERRGAVSLPPAAWKNKKQLRTISMIAAPPDSARDGSFSPFHSPQLAQDDFGFLERPFSPPTAPPISPPASLSPSLKAKMSPTLAPTSATSPAWQPSSKKTFKEALKAGFRSSSSTPDAKPARRRSATLDTLVGTETEIPMPGREGLSLRNSPVAAAANGSPVLSARGTRKSDEHHTGQAQPCADVKDSGASSSSSHHDSESQAPSPMTTPEGSRPQSSKDNQAFRLNEAKRVPPLSYENVIAMRGAPTLPAAGHFVPSRTQSPRVSVEQQQESPKGLVAQHGRSGSNVAQNLSSSKSFLTDELWSQPRKPLDPDQLSFTSALTSIDVKRSFVDLNSALQSSNDDVTLLSLDPASKLATTTQKNTGPSSMGFQFDLSPKGSHASLAPPSSYSTRSARAHGQSIQGQTPRPTNKVDKDSSSPQARRDSPDLRMHPIRKASDYLQEARKAAPASPRAPASSNTSTSSQASLSNTNNAISGPRVFALSKPKPSPAASPPAGILSPVSSHPAKRSSEQETTPLGTSISKMLVECCHCKFYQDMPSRVYEAMARPDDIVKDKRLGVSGQVTTCVKCPWCAHNMSTTCCAGYAAIVYLQEKLHGP